MKEIKQIGSDLAGKRLDQIVKYFWPQFSLRAARRLIADGAVTLNGKKTTQGRKLRAGDAVKLNFVENAPNTASPHALLIDVQGDFCFFHKPSGMHTVSLAGRCNSSLEKLAPAILAAKDLPAHAILLQRLDFGTSGIVAAAFNADAAQWYRKMERAGLCAKYYYAVLAGKLEQTAWQQNALDCVRGRKVRWLDMIAEPLNWTCFQPVAFADGKTLAVCKIKMGQRHQIRAHAAAMGYPLFGDALYARAKGQNFLLAHFRLEFPGHVVEFLDQDSAIRRLFAESISSTERKCMS